MTLRVFRVFQLRPFSFPSQRHGLLAILSVLRWWG